MKRSIILAVLTSSAFGATDVKDFSDLIGRDNPRKAFKEVLKQHPIVVVKCVSTHCPKCKKVAPKFAALAEKYRNKALFLDMNVQKFDDITDEFNLRSVPTFIIFIHGKPYKKIPIVADTDKLDEVALHVSSAVNKLT